MNIKVLPNYTSERYYLLSEIEQRATFTYLSDFPDSGTDHRISIGCFCCIYILWDLRKLTCANEAEFEINLVNLLSRLSYDKGSVQNHSGDDRTLTLPPTSLLAVEVIIDAKALTESENDHDPKNEIERVINRINAKYQSISCIYVGISDSVAGAPALEAVLDYVTLIDSHKRVNKTEDSMKVVVIANDTNQMLGHDPSRDPDAESGMLYQIDKSHYSMSLYMDSIRF